MERIGIALPVFLLILLPLGGCGDDDDSGGPTAPAAFDLTGTWSITEVIDDTQCGGSGDTDSWTLTASQSGNSITVTTPDGDFTGTVSGTTLRWTGSYPYDGGTLTIVSMNVQVVDGGDGLDGTVSWRWSDGSTTCNGTTEFTGNRTS